MKIYRRLGAAIGGVALLAGGLVGVATPTQAQQAPGSVGVCFNGSFDARSYPSESQARNFVQGACSDNGYNMTEISSLTRNGDSWTARAKGTKKYPLTPCPDGQTPEYFENTGAWWCTGVGFDVDPGPDAFEEDEPIQKRPPPPPCWDASINNCPVGDALTFSAPKYAMVGVPVTIYAYASWRPDPDSPAQPTQGTAVIRVYGEDYSGVPFNDGVAEWTLTPKQIGEKNFSVSGVVSSGLSGASAYIDSTDASTYVVPYDPEFLTQALKDWRVDIGEKFVITDREQALTHAKKRYKWSVAPKSDDVCAVYKTKKREVKAKFNDYGECTVRWLDRKSAEEGKYTFIVTKPKLNID